MADIELEGRRENSTSAWISNAAVTSPASCHADGLVQDTKATTSRHLDLCQFNTPWTVWDPRIRCDDYRILKAAGPWGPSGSGSTFRFEAMVITLAQQKDRETGPEPGGRVGLPNAPEVPQELFIEAERNEVVEGVFAKSCTNLRWMRFNTDRERMAAAGAR